MIKVIELLAVIAMQPPGEQPEGFWGSIWVPLIIIAFLFYFVVYLPEKRRRQQREKALNSMERGEEVLTSGGIYGTITAITDKTVTVEIAPNVRVKVNKQHITPLSVSKDTGKSKDKGEGER